MVFARNPLSLYLGVASKIHIWKKIEKRPRNSVGWRPRWWHHFFEWKRVPSVPSVGFGKKDCGGPEKKTPKSTPRFQRLEQKKVVWELAMVAWKGTLLRCCSRIATHFLNKYISHINTAEFLNLTALFADTSVLQRFGTFWHINLVLGTPHFSILIGTRRSSVFLITSWHVPENRRDRNTIVSWRYCWLSFQSCLIFMCCFRTYVLLCFCWYWIPQEAFFTESPKKVPPFHLRRALVNAPNWCIEEDSS